MSIFGKSFRNTNGRSSCYSIGLIDKREETSVVDKLEAWEIEYG